MTVPTRTGPRSAPSPPTSEIKSYASRSIVFGRRVIALDRKGELDRRCEVARTRPIRLERGGPFRLNPLDTRLSAASAASTRPVRER